MNSITNLYRAPETRSSVGPTRRKRAQQRRRAASDTQQRRAPRQVRITPAPIVDPEFWTRYAVRDRLGVGSFGDVLKVENTTTGQQYALKLLNENVDAATANEIAALRELNAACPSTLKYYGYLQVPQWPPAPAGQPSRLQDAILMELIRGEEAFELLEEGLTIDSVPFTWFLLERLAPQLACIHAQGLVHSDIKPENIMVQSSADGELYEDARLIDFGLTCTQRGALSGVQACSERRIAGTPIYLAPEITAAYYAGKANSRDYTPASDMFALGATLFTLLTGQSFVFEEQLNKVPTAASIRQRVAEVEQHFRSGDELLDKIMFGLLSPDPATRITAAEIVSLTRQRHAQKRQ